MIKIRYDACIFSTLFVLNACSGILNSFDEVVAEPQIYKVTRLEVGSLPSLFFSGTLTFSGRPIPLSSAPLVQDYREPLFSVVPTREGFDLYKGRPEDGWCLNNKEVTYLLRSTVCGMDLEATILEPFESIFKCATNVPLSLCVTFSALYQQEVNPQALENIFLCEPPLKIEFKEIVSS